MDWVLVMVNLSTLLSIFEDDVEGFCVVSAGSSAQESMIILFVNGSFLEGAVVYICRCGMLPHGLRQPENVR